MLSWAVILNIGAAPMLLMYVGSDGWWMTAWRHAAVSVVVVLIAAAVALVILQRSAGLLLLGLCGLMTVLLAGDAFAGVMSAALADMYQGGCTLTPREAIIASTVPAILAAVPGAVAAVVALAMFAPGIARFLRRDD
jgi:hypothetical protein